MANSISILLVDDHIVFRKGVRMLLETASDLSIVGEAGNGEDALSMLEQLHPDVVVLDWVMPGMNGLEVLKQMNRKHIGTRVIILSMYANETYVSNAMKNHASGYVLKDDIVADLVNAVRSATPERFYTSHSLDKHGLS